MNSAAWWEARGERNRELLLEADAGIAAHTQHSDGRRTAPSSLLAVMLGAAPSCALACFAFVA